jgi:hypothetical protein
MVLFTEESRSCVAERPAEPQARGGYWPGVILLLLAGLLVFVHGCHGDEDDELFTQNVAAPQKSIQ